MPTPKRARRDIVVEAVERALDQAGLEVDAKLRALNTS